MLTYNYNTARKFIYDLHEQPCHVIPKKYATIINDVTKYKIELPKLRYGIPVQSTWLF